MIQDMTRENRLRVFGHVRHTSITPAVIKSELIIVEGNGRGRDRPKLTLDGLLGRT